MGSTNWDPLESVTLPQGPFAMGISMMTGTPGKGQKRDASSDLENMTHKQICLDEEVLTPGDFGLSQIATPEGSMVNARIPQEGSFIDLREEDFYEDFIEVTKKNRKSHGTKNIGVFEEPIENTPSPTPLT